jgi:hypothetical protein
MYNGNSCHAVASYYSNKTWLRTQTVTATATLTHCVVERTPKKKLETATHTLHPRKFVLTVLNAMELQWDVRTEKNVRQHPSNSKKTNKVKSQKTKQDSLLTVVLHSALESRTSTPLSDQFGLLRWYVYMPTPLQTIHRHNATSHE